MRLEKRYKRTVRAKMRLKDLSLTHQFKAYMKGEISRYDLILLICQVVDALVEEELKRQKSVEKETPE